MRTSVMSWIREMYLSENEPEFCDWAYGRGIKVSTLYVVYSVVLGQNPTCLDEDLEDIVGRECSSSGFDLFEKTRDIEWRVKKSDNLERLKTELESYLASESLCRSYKVEIVKC